MKTGKTCKPPVTVATLSLGCVKNIIDTEVFLGRVAASGIALTPYPESADIVLVNTCGFIDSAVEESLDTLRGLVEANPDARVVAVGCLVQRMGEKIFEQVPNLAAAVGLDEEGQLANLLKDMSNSIDSGGGKKQKKRKKQKPILRGPAVGEAARGDPVGDVPRLRITPAHYAYLQLSEGCNAGCTFCVIPKIRGRLRSKPQDMILNEARELAASGARELILVAQDLTAYGADFKTKNKAAHTGPEPLVDLLSALEELDDVGWLRLLYLHPSKVSDALIDHVAKSDKIVPCLDVPFQHASPAVLKRMGRALPAGKDLLSMVQGWQEKIPDLVVRTTFLVGFPGETAEDFDRLVDFAEAGRFPRGGVFSWSPQEGARATTFPDRVPEDLASERADRLRAIIADNARRFAEESVGQTVEAVVDEMMDGYLAARSAAETPDIDPVIRLPEEAALTPGDFVSVKITGTEDLDRVGEVAGQSSV